MKVDRRAAAAMRPSKGCQVEFVPADAGRCRLQAVPRMSAARSQPPTFVQSLSNGFDHLLGMRTNWERRKPLGVVVGTCRGRYGF